MMTRNAFVWIASVALWTGVTCRVVAPQQGITASSGLPRGRRCCGGDHTPCRAASSGTAAAFSPPLHYGNLSQASQEIAWSYQPLRCPKGFRETPYDLDGNQNWLIVSEDGVALRWLELVSKETEEYCVTRTPHGGYRAATCRPDINQICNDRTCIQKCCGEGEVMSLFRRCVKRQGRGFSPEFRSLRGDPVEIPKDLQVIAKVPHCDSIIMLNPQKQPSDRYLILPNSRLYHPANDQYYSIGSYCIDELIEWSVPMALVCNEVRDMTKIYLQTASVAVSCVFLAVTILCHVVVPKLRDTQGLCFLCHMVSLFVADAALFISYVHTYKNPGLACVINGMIIQMSFLATFFWLNVMCFDIWRVIRATVNLVPLTGILSNDSKKFKAYSAYAWGVPFVVTSVSALLFFLPERFVAAGVIRPDFGVNICFLHGDLEILVHFYGLVGALFFVNLLLLGHTIYMLFRAGAAFDCCSKTESPRAFNRVHLDAYWQRFSLFTLMAVCWVTEVLSWKIPPAGLWIVTDLLNSLQGLAVFLIFLLSKKKRHLVVEFCQNTELLARLFRRDSKTLSPT
ncbi:probable G-protein coupled receptor Mth-like 3 [Penaeus chinensis]|uniref:probable G-protein coupled receptor Mth-like 3 n=1 Tax=Penaeus chinensis TaxID=139456 RepID=UPI001FB5AFC3|nr:probable G-protein coupled receptor Mth-like 3 [Penaeus chinensis]